MVVENDGAEIHTYGNAANAMALSSDSWRPVLRIVLQLHYLNTRRIKLCSSTRQRRGTCTPNAEHKARKDLAASALRPYDKCVENATNCNHVNSTPG